MGGLRWSGSNPWAGTEQGRDGAGPLVELRTPGPVLIQAVVDPLEAPWPARTTPDQAIHFAESILRGQPDGIAIARQAIGTAFREMV
jgi:hypothetical protein